LISPLAAQEAEHPGFGQFLKNFNHEKNWHYVGEPQLLTGSDFLDSGREFVEYLMEFKIDSGLQMNVITTKDSILLNVSIYKAPSQRYAFGLYSVEKSPSLTFLDLGFESYVNGPQLMCWYGEFVIIAGTADSLFIKEKYVKEITEKIIDSLPRQKRETPILDSLPEKDFVKHSEKFYMRRWLDQDYFKDIFYADYYTSEGYSRIFIIDNGTTAKADSNFWRYFSFIRANADTLHEDMRVSTDYFIVDEPLWGRTLLAKKNQIIYGILDFRNVEWTEDRLAEILSRLKKRKIVKPG
jgi:hypothetical protein